jgi:hypothetical protein
MGVERECESPMVGKNGGGPNFLSWRDPKTRKLGGCCARATNENTLVKPESLLVFPN